MLTSSHGIHLQHIVSASVRKTWSAEAEETGSLCEQSLLGTHTEEGESVVPGSSSLGQSRPSLLWVTFFRCCSYLQE